MRGFLKLTIKRAGRPGALILSGVAVLFAWALLGVNAEVRQEPGAQALTVQASFADKQSVAPDEPIELTLSRELAPGEGRLAVLIGATDLTDLFLVSTKSLRYGARTLRLPVGETEVEVYLAALNGEWKELARFTLRVGAGGAPTADSQPAQTDGAVNGETPQPQAADANANQAQPAQADQQAVKRRFGFEKFDMAPQLNIGFKSQFAETHFPDSNRSDRPTFADAAINGTWRSEMGRGAFNMQSNYEIVGSSFRNEALRFGDLQDRAPRIDLSSYLMQFQHGSRKFIVGHSSFGAHRHLINSFSSRGLTFTMPVNSRVDVGLVAMNATNIVGWGNFFGLRNRRHSLFGGVLGLELLKRPGGLRVEGGVVDAWFQSNRRNFNQTNINDAERSRGLSARLLAKDKTERARLDAGFTRSQFVNPEDPLLNQGASVVASRRTTRNARYVDASLDLLKEFSFVIIKPAGGANASGGANEQAAQDARAAIEPKKFNLTLNVRYERVDPLFKSIGASAQPDLQQNQVEFIGSFGELNFTAAHTRLNDNLAGIQTILRTNTRRAAFAVNTPLLGLFSLRPSALPNPFLPRIGYTFERVRASADFIPIGGGFEEPGAIPDQANVTQTFTSEWQFKQFRVAYTLNHSLQDNRAIGRERSDLQNFVHGVTVGWNPLTTLEINFDVNFEDANNREQVATNRTLRFGLGANWQVSARQSVNATFATVGAGDLARTNDSRNIELDLQWNYRLTRESENRFRKAQANYFIRYSNRFARTNNFLENVNALTKLQTFNTGLNFIFF
ncbi:MAG: hypothetical protein AB7U82_17735 [Blastocatellales bacterium]